MGGSVISSRREGRTYIAAPPNGRVVRAAGARAGSRSRALVWLATDGMEVLNALSNSVSAACRPGAAVNSATLSQSTLGNRAGLGRSILELEVRVDFEDLGMHLPDSSVESVKLTGGNFDFPHQWLRSITGNTLRDN